MKQGAPTSHDAGQGLRFARAKFRPTALPATLVLRPAPQDRLAAGAGQRLTVVAGSAAPGKSALLSSWAAARPLQPRIDAATATGNCAAPQIFLTAAKTTSQAQGCPS